MSPSKFGKSWLALDLCLSVAMGVPFLGKETEKCGSLYLALEDGERRLKERMTLVLQGNPPPENFNMTIKAGTIENGLISQLENHVKSKPETGLIVIDVLQRIRGKQGRNSNVYALDYDDMGALKSFADKHHICVLILHHTNKLRDDDDPYNTISGTTGLMGSADTIFILSRKKREEKETKFHIIGRDFEAESTVMEFNTLAAPFKWRIVGTVEEQKAKHEREAYENDPIVKTIKGLLAETPSGISLTAGELSEQMPNFTHDIYNPKKIGIRIKTLKEQLFRYDKISHSDERKKNFNLHLFKYNYSTHSTHSTHFANSTHSTQPSFDDNDPLAHVT